MKFKKRLWIFIALSLACVIILNSSLLFVSAGNVIRDSAITLNYGESVKLSAKSGNVSFSTSNKKVACVDSGGTVRSMGRGKCTITAIDNVTGETDKCEITVKVLWWKIFSNLIYFIKNLNCDVCKGNPEDPTATSSDSTSSSKETSSGATNTGTSSQGEQSTSLTPIIHPSSSSDPSSDSSSSEQTETTVSPAEKDYTVSFGGNGDDRIISSRADGAYVYACGQSDSRDGDFANDLPAGSFSAPFGFVTKTDAEGNRVWTSFITDSACTVSPADITVLSNGDVIVVGLMTTRSYTSDAFISRFSSGGELIKTTVLNGSANDELTCAAPTSDGYVVGGKTASTDGDFEGIPDYGNNCSVFMRFDNSDSILWKRYLGGTGISEVSDIDTDDSNNIFVAVSAIASDGEFSSFNGLLNGSLDNIILKYNYSGSLLWYYTLSTNGRDNLNHVISDGSGGCLAGGYFSVSGYSVTGGTLKGKTVFGGIDSYVVKIDSNGAKKWDKSLGGSDNDYITDLLKIKNGFAVSGYTASANGDFSVNHGGFDGFVTILSATGRTITTINIGGTKADVVSTISYSESSLVILGYSVSSDRYFDGLNQYAREESSGTGIEYNIYDSFVSKYTLNM